VLRFAPAAWSDGPAARWEAHPHGGWRAGASWGAPALGQDSAARNAGAGGADGTPEATCATGVTVDPAVCTGRGIRWDGRDDMRHRRHGRSCGLHGTATAVLRFAPHRPR